MEQQAFKKPVLENPLKKNILYLPRPEQIF